jgi:citrate lyase subunit beta / citryl-CoA lyase
VLVRLRTALFVPGDRPARIGKAFGCVTDAVVVDLEDAVADSEKDVARDIVTETLAATSPAPLRLYLRVNGVGTKWFDDDLETCRALGQRLQGVVLPKATTAADVLRLVEGLRNLDDIAIVPIVETAAGVLNAYAVAASSDRVETLLFGAADLSTELQVQATPDGDELLLARSQVVLAAAAAGRRRPLDGPYLRLDDVAGLQRSSALARRLGFGGKAVIHPAQLDTVTATFAPGDDEVQWAQRVHEAFARAEKVGQGSVRLDDGTFVDYPVASRARAILADAGLAEPV